jgi:hypothetical protein
MRWYIASGPRCAASPLASARAQDRMVTGLRSPCGAPGAVLLLSTQLWLALSWTGKYATTGPRSAGADTSEEARDACTAPSGGLVLASSTAATKR